MKTKSINNQLSFQSRFSAKRIFMKRKVPVIGGGFIEAPLKTGSYDIKHMAEGFEGRRIISRLFTKLRNWHIKRKFGIQEAKDMETSSSMLIMNKPLFSNLDTDVQKVRVNSYVQKLDAPNAVVELRKGVIKGDVIAKKMIEV